MMKLKMSVSWCAFVRWKQMLAKIVLWQTNRAERWPCRSQMQLMSRLKCISLIVCLAKTQNRWVEIHREWIVHTKVELWSSSAVANGFSFIQRARAANISREKPTTNRTHWFFNLSKALLVSFLFAKFEGWKTECFRFYQVIFQH